MAKLTPQERTDREKELPIAIATSSQNEPVPPEAITELLKPFIGASTAYSYLGPAGIAEDGVPWLVVVSQNDKRPSVYRQAPRFAMLGWRWNITPACPFSLTVMGLKEPRPHMRWIGASENQIVRAIRETGRFRVCIAHPSGNRSGWFDAVFSSGGGYAAQPSTEALERQWSFPTAGIPNSRLGERFDPWSRDKRDDEDGEDEIPLWVEPISDVWKTLKGKGPWTEDLEEQDLKTADWGSWVHTKRSRAAGFVQAIKERQQLDGQTSVVNTDGNWLIATPDKAQIEALMRAHPALRDWIVALAGPTPDALTAHEAAFQMLNTPTAIYAFAAKFMGLLGGLEDFVLAEAIQNSYEAALLDTRITDLGHKRPWLKNTGYSRLEMRTITLDPNAPREDLETLWASGLTFADLLDAGEWFGPSDLPAPFQVVNEALKTVCLEGSVEEAQERVMQLLHEAQEVRQWSIPWGARVQIQFGPFVAMRIFEKEGEFSCHFLDERDRYLHLAIGLGRGVPRISGVQLIRQADDGGDPVWNDDAEACLQLIAAAIVRDFLVVEDRESVFTTRPMRRRIAGRNINTIIYLPRVHYSHIRSDQPESNEPATKHRPRHVVTHHLRRAGKASAAQRFLAQRYGVALPEGFTFVRPHERGTEAHEERIRLYRSRSASRMIFEEVAAAPEGSRPAWFDFEKDCAKLLASEGMKVVHQAAKQDGDGGVDLFAVDSDGHSWVVQCKCWSPHRLVGPDVVRELVGAIASADRGATQASRGMIITTSTLTSGAANEAITHGFRIVDGPTFACLVQTLSN